MGEGWGEIGREGGDLHAPKARDADELGGHFLEKSEATAAPRTSAHWQRTHCPAAAGDRCSGDVASGLWAEAQKVLNVFGRLM